MSIGSNKNTGTVTIEKTRKKVNQRLYAFLALVVIYIFFCFMGRNFFGLETALNILDASNYIGFMAIGVTFVIISGGIDLSLGTVAMCSALLGGVAYNIWKWPIAICLVFVI